MAITHDRYAELRAAQDRALETAKQILAELCRRQANEAGEADDVEAIPDGKEMQP